MEDIKNTILNVTQLSQRGVGLLLAVVAGLMLMTGLMAYSSHNVVSAADVAGGTCKGAQLEFSNTEECDTEGAAKQLDETLNNGINIFSVIIGAVAVIMIIYAGFRYIVSGGSSDGVKGARNTLIYAIVGLVVVLLAQTVVKYVLSQFTGSDDTGTTTTTE